MRIGKKKLAIIILFVCIIIGGYVAYCLLRPINLTLAASHPKHVLITPGQSKLAWPNTGQAAVGIQGSNNVETRGTITATQTASVAKLITCLVVLKNKPLALNEQGPSITLSPSDVAIYNSYVSEQGSVVAVVAGETITEYQMLQAVLLPSANNIADSMAVWAYGSLPNYSTSANEYLAKSGLHDTHVGSDASGYNPSTTSTAKDLVMLGKLAIQNPVIAQIVSQPAATGIPQTTTVKNVNFLLGNNNINGIKTGNTTQAGGVFVSSSYVIENYKPITIVTAYAAAKDLSAALHESLPLITSAQKNFSTVSIVKAGDKVGMYELPWGGSVQIISSGTISFNAWNDSPVIKDTSYKTIKSNSTTNTSTGTITASQKETVKSISVNLKLKISIPKPTIWWRLIHPI